VDENVKQAVEVAEPEIRKSLAQLLEYANDAGQFAVDRAPHLAREIIAWGVASSVIWILVSSVALLACVYATRRGFEVRRNDPKEWPRNSDEPFILWAVSAGVAVFAAPALLVAIFNISKALVSPRLYLVERLVEMLK
jgi:hypothetical protein